MLCIHLEEGGRRAVVGCWHRIVRAGGHIARNIHIHHPALSALCISPMEEKGSKWTDEKRPS